MDFVVGVDVHKQTHTLVVVDRSGRKLAQKTIQTTSTAHLEVIRWVRAPSATTWCGGSKTAAL